MERITSRKNAYIQYLRALAADASARREHVEFLCDGIKLYREALTYGAAVTSVLWKENGTFPEELDGAANYIAPENLFDYASPMKNSPGPLFTVRIRGCSKPGKLPNAVVLDGVQDPGNVGTVIRTANAFGIGAVILTGDCADPYHPKTARATMGAIFRQTILTIDTAYLGGFLLDQGLALYGAALSDTAQDIRTCDLRHSAVAIGSEGKGLSDQVLSLCEERVLIPMQPQSESLNAAVAAAVAMWEMTR